MGNVRLSELQCVEKLSELLKFVANKALNENCLKKMISDNFTKKSRNAESCLVSLKLFWHFVTFL